MEKVPVLFIIFNRKDISLNSFSQIKQYQPRTLYIAADGARNEAERLICNETREAICSRIDWNCEVKTLFRDENVGVDKAVYSAISWMFEFEPWGVIVEDDCFLSLDFFTFCEAAFEKYKDNQQVVHIAANNILGNNRTTNEVQFGYFPQSWGWGTWKRAWTNVMDTEMNGWDKYSVLRAVMDYGLFSGLMFYYYWTKNYSSRAKIETWDGIWQFSVMSTKSLCLYPVANLAINNGIGTSDASHYKIGDENYYQNLILDELQCPVDYPTELVVDKAYDKLFRRYFFKLRIFGFKQKVKKILRRKL